MKAILLAIDSRKSPVRIEKAPRGFDDTLKAAAKLPVKANVGANTERSQPKPLMTAKDDQQSSATETRAVVPKIKEGASALVADATPAKVNPRPDVEEAVLHFESQLDDVVLEGTQAALHPTEEHIEVRLPDSFDGAVAATDQAVTAVEVSGTTTTDPAVAAAQQMPAFAVPDVVADTHAGPRTEASVSGFGTPADAPTVVTRSEASSDKGEEPPSQAFSEPAATTAGKAPVTDFEVPALKEAPVQSVTTTQVADAGSTYSRAAAPSRQPQAELQSTPEATVLDFEAYESTVRMRSADKAELRIGTGDSKVTVVLHERGDRVFVSAQTATSELAKALEADASHLGQSLSAHGLDLGGFEASTEPNQPNQPDESETETTDDASSRVFDPLTHRRRIIA